MKACRALICSATVFAVAGVAFATPPEPPKNYKKIPVDFSAVPPHGAGAGVPLCETTGFEESELNCNWDYAGMGICGPQFICRDRNVDPPYPACSPPPTVNPDNCCVANPGANDWWMSGSSQHCQQPSIDTVHPATGSQHLRFAHSDLGGNPAGCVAPDINLQDAVNSACRTSAFTTNSLPTGQDYNPGVTTTSYDISRDAPSGVPGSAINITQQSPAVGGAYVRITYLGYAFAYDFVLQNDIYLGGFAAADTYVHFQHIYDVCGDSIQWFWDGAMVGSNVWDGRMNSAEQNVLIADNAVSGLFDIDNFTVDRVLEPDPVCPTICNNGNLETGEECDLGPGLDACCPGQCGAFGTPEQCTCPEPTNTLFTCTSREVFNGANGPFISDGGLYSYTADALFTSVDTCGSGFDSQIFWALTPDCGQFVDFNDDCWDSDNGATQTPGDPNASCYGGPDFVQESCVCEPTVPGTTYTFLVAEWQLDPPGSTYIPPFCSATIVNITKKTSCDLGGPIPGGACCDQLTGTCTDGVAAVDCADQYDVYSVNKLCSMVECVALNGACCNTAPGAGGACVETTQANCPVGQYQTWTVGVACDSVACDEVTGSCCDTISGSCSTGVIQGACAGQWTEGGTCSSCVAATGACCVDDGLQTAACTDGQTLAACNAAGGVWTQGTACADLADPCQSDFIAIPTVSEWGLAVLALMLLIGGKIYFSRREAAMA